MENYLGHLTNFGFPNKTCDCGRKRTIYFLCLCSITLNWVYLKFFLRLLHRNAKDYLPGSFKCDLKVWFYRPQNGSLTMSTTSTMRMLLFCRNDRKAMNICPIRAHWYWKTDQKEMDRAVCSYLNIHTRKKALLVRVKNNKNRCRKWNSFVLKIANNTRASVN